MDSQIPAYLHRQGRNVSVDATAGMGMPPVPYLSIEENKFTLYDASGQSWSPQTYGPIVAIRGNDGQLYPAQGSPVGVFIDLVVVDSNLVMSKVYYADAYSPTAAKGSPPDCWSDNGVAPSVGAARPQNDTCELCPHNQWGSKINALGNQVKACDDVKKLGIVVPQVLNEMGLKTVFLFRLKGSSHKNWRAYNDKLSRISLGNRSADVTDVVTRVFFQPGKIGVLDFMNVAHIDQPTAQLEDEVWSMHACDTLLGKLDRPRAPTGLAIVPPKGISPPPPPAAAAAPLGFQSVQLPSATAPTGFGNVGPGPGTKQGGFLQGAPTQGPAQQGPEAPRKRTPGRPRKDGTPAGTAPAAGFAGPTAVPTVPFPAQANPAPPEATFGMAQPAQAPAEVTEALKNALGPLPPRQT